ncbi:MAG: hypothetical protein AB1656_01135 [Candidatus Omnitrophota bacterium]
MNTAIQLNQNDAGVKIVFLCRDEDGRPIDLTKFTVDFFLYDGETLLNEGRTLCGKPDSQLGEADYLMTADDTSTCGLFMGKLRLSNSVADVRNIGGIPVEIRESF